MRKEAFFWRQRCYNLRGKVGVTMAWHLTKEERRQLAAMLRGWADTRDALRMRRYIQHGSVTTYDHCMSVARASFWLNRRLHLGADEASLVRGAFLHDFYLYDWHEKDRSHRLHGFTHPATALRNAQARYPLDWREQDIIRSHMWPLTMRQLPRCREAVVVSLADKGCSLRETLFRRKMA